MVRALILTLICLLGSIAQANEFEAPPSAETKLVISGAADYPEIKPILAAFSAKYPMIKVQYTEYSTRDLYLDAISNKSKGMDLILSSAMDLQIKLVNDGYAQPYRSSETAKLPTWARWRDEIFGYSYEPATIAVNKTFFGEDPIPQNRADMLEYIRRNAEITTGRLATFDIAKVGVGYLLWAHDSQQTGNYGRILESFGAHDARVFPSSASMLGALAAGEIMIAYNVLGSYAASWSKAHPDIVVVLPRDYTTVLMRSAFIPKNANNIANARRFLDYLLSEEGQQVLAEKSSFYPVREDLQGNVAAKSLRVSAHGPLRPIALGLPLLVLSDQMKRQLLLEEWERALIELE